MRVNFNYFISEAVLDYVVEAVRLVAREGWRLLGDYRFDPATGRWHHRRGPVEPPLRLSQVGYDADGALTYPRQHDQAAESALQGYLAEAAQILREATPCDGDGSVSADFDHLRWFELPPASLSGG